MSRISQILDISHMYNAIVKSYIVLYEHLFDIL